MRLGEVENLDGEVKVLRGFVWVMEFMCGKEFLVLSFVFFLVIVI